MKFGSVRPQTRTTILPIFIGGVLGGLVVFVLILVFGVLYLKRQRRNPIDGCIESSVGREKDTQNAPGLKRVVWSAMAALNGLWVCTRLSKRHGRRSILNSITVEPWVYNSDSQPSQGKRQRLYEVQQTIEGAQRLRENMQLDLESLNRSLHSSRTTDALGRVELLIQQIGEMSVTIAALQDDISELLKEDQPPPNYSSMM